MVLMLIPYQYMFYFILLVNQFNLIIIVLVNYFYQVCQQFVIEFPEMVHELAFYSKYPY